MAKKTYATEEEKSRAIEEFDINSKDQSLLDDIMNAEIVPVDSGEPVEKPVEPQSDVTPSADVPPTVLETPVPDGQTVPTTPDETPQETQESEVDRLKRELDEKNKYIQEALGSIDTIRSLEQKVVSLENQYQATPPTTPAEKKEMRLRESKLAELQNRRKLLLEKYPSIEDQMDPEYQKESNEIQSGLFDEISTLQENMRLIQQHADTAVQKADKYLVQRQEDAERSRMQESQNVEMKQIEDFTKTVPELRMDISMSDANKEYIEYQTNVAKVYYGREPRNLVEVNEAMNMLKRRSPGLVTKLNAAGIPQEPSANVKKYLAACEVWDYWKGYRKDPLTGDYHYDKNGNVIPLTRYEPSIGKYVPDVYPDPVAAFNDKSAREGFYTRQLVKAKIDGGKQVIHAINERAKGATELGATETHGGSMLSVEEALNRANQMDPREIVMAARDGDMSLLNEYNQYAKTLGWSEVDPFT
jgi:hypothetical protein